jgi:hypothetical protein
MSRWVVAPGGGHPGGNQLALQGPVRGEARHPAAGRGAAGAWGGHAGPQDLRAISPRPRNTWQRLGPCTQECRGSDRLPRHVILRRLPAAGQAKRPAHRVTEAPCPARCPVGIPRSAGGVTQQAPPQPARGVQHPARGRPLGGAVPSRQAPSARQRGQRTRRVGTPSTGGRATAGERRLGDQNRRRPRMHGRGGRRHEQGTQPLRRSPSAVNAARPVATGGREQHRAAVRPVPTHSGYTAIRSASVRTEVKEVLARFGGRPVRQAHRHG